MPFGINIPTASGERTESGGFLGRLQHDATQNLGGWKYVKRVQMSDGSWGDEESDPLSNPSFLMDVASFEYGWIKFHPAPPDFRLVPFGQPAPDKPSEMFTDQDGKSRSAYRVGFRVKVYNPKLFGDKDPYYFSNASEAVNTPMDELLHTAIASSEFKAGKTPLVAVTGRTKIEPRMKTGKVTYGPVFEIKGWHDRPECFGERTVFAIEAVAPFPSSQAPLAKPAPASRHVGPPAAVAKAQAMADQVLEDSIPF